MWGYGPTELPQCVETLTWGHRHFNKGKVDTPRLNRLFILLLKCQRLENEASRSDEREIK